MEFLSTSKYSTTEHQGAWEGNIHCQQLTWEECFSGNISSWDRDPQQKGFPFAFCGEGYFQCSVTEC